MAESIAFGEPLGFVGGDGTDFYVSVPDVYSHFIGWLGLPGGLEGSGVGVGVGGVGESVGAAGGVVGAEGVVPGVAGVAVGQGVNAGLPVEAVDVGGELVV